MKKLEFYLNFYPSNRISMNSVLTDGSSRLRGHLKWDYHYPTVNWVPWGQIPGAPIDTSFGFGPY